MMPTNKLVCACIATFWLAGCSLAPQYERPAAPVPPVIGQTAAKGTVKFVLPEWQKWFTDPVLQQVLMRAFAQNRDLRLVAAQLKGAQAQYGIQKAEQTPTLNLNATESANRNPSMFGGGSMVLRQYGINLGMAAFELDFWGRVKNLTEAALESYLATEEGQRATRLSLVTAIANDWYSLGALQTRLDFANKTVQSREAHVKIMHARLNRGLSNRLDSLQAETALDSARQDAANLSNQIDQTKARLALLIGEPLQVQPSLWSKAPLPPVLPEGLASSVLLNRPDIIQAEHRLKAANANIGAARAAYFPSISLVAAFGLATRDLDNLFQGQNRSWSFAPTVTMPLFDGGSRKAREALAEANAQAAVAEYEKAIQTAFMEVSQVLADQHWLAAQLKIQQQQADRQKERLRLAQSRYRVGLVGYLDVLDAERDYYNAQQTVLELQRARLAASAQAYKVMGGL